jgi:hypothetical protein
VPGAGLGLLLLLVPSAGAQRQDDEYDQRQPKGMSHHSPGVHLLLRFCRFWYVFEVGAVLKIAAVLLSGFVVSSGLLFVHYRRQESYMTFEASFFLVCFAIGLVNLLWIAPVRFFL